MQTCTEMLYDGDEITNHQRRCLQISKCAKSEWNAQTHSKIRKETEMPAKKKWFLVHKVQ